MKVLIITEYITPVASIAAVRWTKLSKYLSIRNNVDVDILTNQKRFLEEPQETFYQYDETISGDERYFHHVYKIPRGFRVKIADGFFRLVEKAVQARSKSSSISSETDSSESQTKESLIKKIFYKLYGEAFDIKGRGYCAMAYKMPINWNEYDAIISSFGPKWVHLISAKIKADHPDIVWIADFRDPALASADVPKDEKPVFADKYAGTADALTAVTQETFDVLGAQHACQRVITNGFDPDELRARNRQQKDMFLISYTGTLYNNRDNKQVSDLKPIMSAVSELIQDGAVDIEDVRFVYAGWNSEYFESQIMNFDNVPYNDLGPISREDALALQNESSILVLCTWNTDTQQGVATGKSYEYLSSKVPVAAICSGNLSNSLAKEMVEGANVGVCFEEASAKEDFEKLKSFVLEKYQQWKLDGITSCNANWDYINSFGYDALAQEFYDLIKEINIHTD